MFGGGESPEQLAEDFWENSIDRWFSENPDMVDIYCPICGQVPEQHLHVSLSGDKDWKCPEQVISKAS